MLWWLVQNAVGALVLAGVVTLLTRLVRLSPVVSHVLWLLVIVKLLAPPLLVLPWPAEPVVVPQAAPMTASETPPLVLRGTAEVPVEPVPAGRSPETGTSLYTRWAAWVRTTVSAIPFQNASAYLWIVGALAMAALQLGWLARLRWNLRKGHPLPPWLAAELQDVAGRMAVSVPRAVIVPNGSPLLLGGIRPTLVLPASLLDQLDADGRRTVLTHELAHLKRRDHWTGCIELWAACVWWWNPVFWYARRRMRESAEYACDAWVVRLLPQGRRAYAESLITVVASLTRQPLPVATIGMAAQGRRIFERRLQMILREAVPNRMSRLTAAGLALAALIMLPGWAQPGSEQPKDVIISGHRIEGMKEVPEDKAYEEPEYKGTKLDKICNIEFKDQHLSGIIDYLVEYCEVNIVIDPRAVVPAPPRPRHDAEGNELPPPPQPDTNSEQATDAIVAYIRLEDVPLSEVLSALLAPLNLEYQVIGHVIFISTPALLDQVDFPQPQIDPEQQELAQKLTSIEFETEELSRILDYVTHYHGVACKIDPQAKLPVNGKPAEQAVVSYVRLEDVPLWEALYWITSPMGLTCVYKGATVWITTPDRVKSIPVPRATTPAEADKPRNDAPAAPKDEERKAAQEPQTFGIALSPTVEAKADTQAPPPPSRHEPAKVAAAPPDLDQLCTLEFENTNVIDVANYLSEAYGVNFVLDQRIIRRFTLPPGIPPTAAGQPSPLPRDQKLPFSADGMVQYVKLHEVPLRDALSALLRPLRYEYKVVGHVVYISVPLNMDNLEQEFAAWQERLGDIPENLEASTSLEFEAIKVEEAVDLIRDSLNIDCRIDREARIEYKQANKSVPLGDEVVTHVKLKGIPTWEALYWLTQPMDMTVAPKGGTVWITTLDHRDALPETAPAVYK